MKFIFYTLVFSLFPVLIFSQKPFKYKDRYLPVTYVLKGKKDSIKTRIMNTGSVADNSKFSYYTLVFKKMKMMDSLGNATIIPRDEIGFMEITDQNGKKWKFWNSNRFMKKDYKGMVEVLFSGKKTKLCHNFGSDSYTGVLTTDYFIAYNGEEYNVNARNLKKIFDENNEAINDDIEKIKNVVDVKSFLEKYDK